MSEKNKLVVFVTCGFNDERSSVARSVAILRDRVAKLMKKF